MKSLTVFSQLVLNDLGTRCSVDTTRDCETVAARCEDEGLSFLTITLPTFGKSLETGLRLGRVDSTMFPGFRAKGHGGTPAFLQGFLRRIFNSKTGELLDDADWACIRAVRQFCLMFAKIKIPVTPEREAEAFSAFVKCEQEVAEWPEPDFSLFRHCSVMLWGDLFSDLDLKVYLGEVVPKHGSGSTADRLLGNQKFNGRKWYSRLDPYFPIGDYAIPSHRHWRVLDDFCLLEPEDEIPVRVISVPKTQSAPRIIAMEPTHVQYVQQGLLEMFVDGFRRHHYPSGFVLSDSQIPNQELALQGSRDGSLATLDLSEASDRVSLRHVEELLHRWPHLRGGLLAARSTKAAVPGHGVVTLSKFASMGSAVCFPVEALVFCTLVFAGICRQLNTTSLSHRLITEMMGQVRVYGDDIIVPVAYAESVVRELESFGMKVNRGKSFWTGEFRESCGADYWRGHDVSVVRVRTPFPNGRRDVPSLESTVSLRNQLANAGWLRFPRSVGYLDEMIGRLIPFPVVRSTSRVWGRHDDLPYTVGRWDDALQIPLVRGCWAASKPPPNSVDGVGALMKALLKRGDEPIADVEHLERSGRPVSVNIKSGWASPF